MKQIYIVIFISLFFGTACRKTASVGDVLAGTKWTLSSVQDTKTNTVLIYPGDASRKISIVFADSLNTIVFSGICNGGTGTYSVSSDRETINVVNLGSTKVYCKYAEWETYTVQNMNTAFRYIISGTTLTVYSAGDYNLNFISQ